MADNNAIINTDNITINTHSSIRIEGSKVLYFDPFEINRESHDADIIFVTHDHYDHFDIKSIGLITNDKTIIVAPKSMSKQVIAKSGISEDRCIFMDPEDKQQIEEVDVEAVRAYNRLKPFHMKSKGFLGYVVAMEGARYYVAGDTDFIEEMNGVRCDVALVPVGGTYTMDKKSAAEAIAAIKPAVAIPTHYGSIAGKADDGRGFIELISTMGIKGVLKIG